jgi:hypothetical protein
LGAAEGETRAVSFTGERTVDHVFDKDAKEASLPPPTDATFVRKAKAEKAKESADAKIRRLKAIDDKLVSGKFSEAFEARMTYALIYCYENAWGVGATIFAILLGLVFLTPNRNKQAAIDYKNNLAALDAAKKKAEDEAQQQVDSVDADKK